MNKISKKRDALKVVAFYYFINMKGNYGKMENENNLNNENKDNDEKSAFDLLQEQNKELLKRIEKLEQENKEKDNSIKRMLLEGSKGKEAEDENPVDIISRDIIKKLGMKEKR